MAYNNSKQKLISETLRKKKSKQEEERVGWAQDQRPGRTKKKKQKCAKADLATRRRLRLKAGRVGRSAEQELGGMIGEEKAGQHDWEAT
jgi:hypothetical protein